MTPLSTVSPIYLASRLLLVVGIALSIGCVGDHPAPPSTQSEAVVTLIDQVLPHLSSHSLPRRMADLLQTAPRDEDDTAYWQWYQRTLATTNATTTYCRDTDHSVSLRWDFDDIRQSRLSLHVYREENKLVVDLSVRALAVRGHYYRGTYRSMWQMADGNYRQINEENHVAVTLAK